MTCQKSTEKKGKEDPSPHLVIGVYNMKPWYFVADSEKIVETEMTNQQNMHSAVQKKKRRQAQAPAFQEELKGFSESYHGLADASKFCSIWP